LERTLEGMTMRKYFNSSYRIKKILKL
jgi:hypothetical protein